tara:strand:+ start:13267 stop:13941 length:675 start_codon:yes stop_codon:yes gene_type:complete
MSNFRTQIENLAGKSSFATTAEEAEYTNMLNNFLLQSARNVLDVLDDSYLAKNAITATITNGDGLTFKNKILVKVLRNNVGCVEVPLEMKSKVSGTSSIYSPTDSSPVYFIEGQSSVEGGAKLFIKPNPSAQENGIVYHLAIPSSISNTATSITNFPDEAEYAVVLGSAVRLLQHKLNKLLHDDEDVELSQVVQNEMQLLNNMYLIELNQLNGGGMQIQNEGAE